MADYKKKAGCPIGDIHLTTVDQHVDDDDLDDGDDLVCQDRRPYSI